MGAHAGGRRYRGEGNFRRVDVVLSAWGRALPGPASSFSANLNLPAASARLRRLRGGCCASGASRWAAPARGRRLRPGRGRRRLRVGPGGRRRVAHAREMGMRAAPARCRATRRRRPRPSVIRRPGRRERLAGDRAAPPPARGRLRRAQLHRPRRRRAGSRRSGRIAHRARGWERLQWNFLPQARASTRPRRGRNLFADHRPGGQGVIVAVLDTGVAYRDWKQLPGSRPTSRARSSSIRTTSSPTTRSRSTARATARSSPGWSPRRPTTDRADRPRLRRVDHAGPRARRRAARRLQPRSRSGIRYAVKHGAQVINLSLEFDSRRHRLRHPGDHQRDQLRPPPWRRRGRPPPATMRHGELAYPARRAGGDLGRRDDQATAAWPPTPTSARSSTWSRPGGGDDASLATTPTATRPQPAARSTR